MNRMVCVFVVVGVGLLGWVAATSAGSPPANSVSWLLVGGKMRKLGKAGAEFAGTSIGVQLHAPMASPTTITPDLNPTTGASGTIFVGPFPKECEDTYHFHGLLYGVQDTGKRCGWGEAIPFDQATDAAGFLSAAFMLEVRAQKKAFGTTPADIAGATQDLNDAFSEMGHFSDAIDALTASGGISEAARLAMQRVVSKIRMLDTAALAEGVTFPAEGIINRAIAKKTKLMKELEKKNADSSSAVPQ